MKIAVDLGQTSKERKGSKLNDLPKSSGKNQLSMPYDVGAASCHVDAGASLAYYRWLEMASMTAPMR